MNKYLLVFSITLSVIVGGCAKKSEVPATDSSHPTSPTKPLPGTSTTSIMPPQGNDPRGFTAVTFTMPHSNPFFVFFQATQATAGLHFVYDTTRIAMSVQMMGTMHTFKFSSRDTLGGATLRFLTNMNGADTTSFYTNLFEIPSSQTKNVYIGSYSAPGFATVIVGDSGVVMP